MPTDASLNRFAADVLEVMPLMVREFARREDNDLTRGKISCPQMVALHHAAQRGEVPVSEIARLLNISNSSASVLLDRLIRQKLMTRRQDQKDRRVVRVGITAKGRQVVSQIMSQKRRSIKAIFGRLTRKERGQYLSVLLKVKSHLVASCAAMFIAALLLSQNAEAFLTPPLEHELTLQQAYEKALKRSESVAITAEEMNQAQARFYRAFDYFLPTVSFEMTRFYQDTNGGTGGFGNSQRQNTPEKKFVFSQPLFSGFKEIASLQGTGADKKQQALAWKRAKELLFVDVMEAFYAVLEAQKDVEVLASTHELLDNRMKDLEERVKLGRSRDSEIKTSVADLKLIESDLVDAKAQVRVSKNLLTYYVGEPIDEKILKEEEELPAVPATSDILKKSTSRSDVLSDEQAYIVAEKGVVVAQADLFPTISLDGNYYTQRVGFQNGNDWDMTLKFDVPVFEVGQTLGDIKEAVSDREKARLKYEQDKRLALLDIQNAHEDLESSRESEKALSEAHQASKENYDILSKEYLLNLVNNLEVLDALRRHEDIAKRYYEARYTARKNYWKLKVALGEIGVSP